MIVKGNLSDVSLGTIIHSLFQSRWTAILWLCQQSIEGIVFFDKGQMTHAKVNGSEGQEAIYVLSHWDHGTFRIMQQEVLPPHDQENVLDYPVNESAAPKIKATSVLALLTRESEARTTEEYEADQVWEQELIVLLSILERLKTELGRWRYRFRPNTILGYLTDIVNEVVTVGENSFDIYRNFLEKAINMASDVYPQATQLQLNDNQLDPLPEIYNTLPRQQRSTQIQAVISSVLDILESYFYQFVSRFHATNLVEQWRVTCQLYLEELEGTLNYAKL